MKHNYKMNRKIKRGGANNNNNNNSGNNTPTPGGNNAPPSNNNSSSGNNAPPGGNNTPPGGNNTPPSSNNAPVGNNAPPGGNNTPPGGNNAPSGNNNASNNAPTGNNTPSNNRGNNAVNNKLLNKMKNGIDQGISSGTNILGAVSGKMSDGMAQVGKVRNINLSFEDNYVRSALLVLLAMLVVFGLLVALRMIVKQVYKGSQNHHKTALISGTRDAKNYSYVSQDPQSISYNPILKSDNQNGIEFTYSFWMLIQDLSTHKSGDWKHVFHKGSRNPYPNRAPGVWLHPYKNTMRVYMNTFKDPLFYLDIHDVPVKKWFHVNVILQNVNSHTEKTLEIVESKEILDQENNHVLDVYINGQNKKSKILDALPRQNNGDLHMGLEGGFHGYISKFNYFPYALDHQEITNLIEEGPSGIPVESTGDLPPYLNDKWWLKYQSDLS